ncbi:hypothetical protein NQZ68_006098 [Dissostichus eleginoides]|nr:hypothetical protein NQZ68_006098 [Dissostichus eleginoides]
MKNNDLISSSASDPLPFPKSSHLITAPHSPQPPLAGRHPYCHIRHGSMSLNISPERCERHLRRPAAGACGYSSRAVTFSHSLGTKWVSQLTLEQHPPPLSLHMAPPPPPPRLFRYPGSDGVAGRGWSPSVGSIRGVSGAPMLMEWAQASLGAP